MREIIALRIKNLRESNNLTAEDVSKAIGINRSTYSNYENGNRDFPHQVIKDIAEYYQVSIDYIYGITHIYVR